LSKNISNEYGNITIDDEIIQKVAGFATIECFGVVGMSSQNRIKDGVHELLKRSNASKGVCVRKDEEGVHIDLHIVAAYGVKVPEVSLLIQEKVSYELTHTLGISPASINIFINGIGSSEVYL
jgi:uncharacterized alkaline shock family protein YloU